MFTKKGPNVHAESKHVRTALHFAVEYNRAEEVRNLLKNGADINAEDETGSTPLHFAAVWCDHEIANILIEHGAFIDSKTKEGKTALHVASRIGNESVIATLIENGASINDISDKCVNECGGAAIHFAVEFNQPYVVELLFKAEAEINCKNIDGMSPLHIAAKRDNCLLIELLLKLGADINAIDSEGKTPLMIGTLEGNDDVVNKLVEKGADLNMISDKCKPQWTGGPCPQGNGGSALHFAVMYSRRNILNALLIFGADVETKNLDGSSPLHTAALIRDSIFAQILIEAGTMIESRDEEGRTALHVASSNNNAGVVTLLIEAGADINAVCDKSKRYAGFTALHFAVEFQWHSVVLVLLNNRAGLEAKDMLGKTPLHLSALSYTKTIADSLLTAGVYVDPKDYAGHTPLYVALTYGNAAVVTLLLAKGADVKLADLAMELPREELRLHMERLNRDHQHSYCFFILTNYIVMRNTIGMKVCPAYLNFNLDLDGGYIESTCREELPVLKQTNIGIYNLTYYEFLKKSVHEIRLILKSEGLRSELSNLETYKKQFPLSALLISSHYHQGMIRRALMDKFSSDSCGAALNLPYGSVQGVLEHLTNEDLRSFGSLFPKI